MRSLLTAHTHDTSLYMGHQCARLMRTHLLTSTDDIGYYCALDACILLHLSPQVNVHDIAP
jgi:hypothetical protein